MNMEILLKKEGMKNNEAMMMSPTSTGGGYRFAFQAARISPASLKRAEVRKFFYKRKIFYCCVIII